MFGLAIFGIVVLCIIALTIIVYVLMEIPDIAKYLHLLKMSSGRRGEH